jgi:TatD DNase family protein
VPAIIDSHAHLTWESFAEDQSQVIQRALDNGVVQMIQAGVDLDTIAEMIALAEKYPQIYIAPGLHPHEAKLWSDEAEAKIRAAAGHPKAVAIGECGLDFHYNHSDRESQLLAFKKQVQMALELDKPLIIHTREAWDDTFAILEDIGAGRVKGVFHCFTGGPEQLPKIEALDFYVSFSGIVTFSNAKAIQAAAPLVKADRILVETDCPYLAPQPVRGKRNEPSYVWMVAQKVADLRGAKLEEIAQLTSTNARALFRIAEPIES